MSEGFSNLIVAFIGLAGVLLGSFITLLKDWLFEWKGRQRRAAYLSTRIACILDNFIYKCHAIVNDKGERDVDGCLEPQVNLPETVTFPEDIDWQSIDPKLAARILSLPNKISLSNETIDTVCLIDSSPDYKEVFLERRHQYALLGVECYSILNALNKKFATSNSIVMSELCPESSFISVISEREEARKNTSK